MDLLEALGFNWDRTMVPDEVPVHSVEHARSRFHRMLAEFVWDPEVLEGNPSPFEKCKRYSMA